MRECNNCKHSGGIGSDVWCNHNPKGNESYMFETDCPYYEYHDRSKGVPSKTTKRYKRLSDNLLNKLNKKNQQLKKENEQLKKENKKLKELVEYFADELKIDLGELEE